MVAVLGNKVIVIASVLLCKFLHHFPNLSCSHLCPSYQDPSPECEPFTMLRISLEDPRCWVLMSSVSIFHTINLDARMVDSEAKPVGIAIEGIDVIDIEVNWYGPT